MKRTSACLWAAILGLAATDVHALEFGYSAGTNNRLYQINLSNGQATDLGDIGLLHAEGMAFNGATLLGVGGEPDPQTAFPQQLWNLSTPPGSFIGNTAITTDDDSGLAAHNGQLWAVQGNIFGSQIVQLNPATGSTIQTALITTGQSDPYLDSLAIDSSGNAFAVDAIFSNPLGALYSIDLTGTLGTAALIGSLGIADPVVPQNPLSAQSGLDFDSNDTLYLLLSDGRLYTIDTTTGNGTFVANVEDNGNPLTFHGGFAIGDFDAAAVIPEPATMMMVIVGAGMMITRRRV